MTSPPNFAGTLPKSYDGNSLWTAVTREFPTAIVARPYLTNGKLSQVDITYSVRKQYVQVSLKAGNGSFERIVEDFAPNPL